jgi:hypothetical protein
MPNAKDLDETGPSSFMLVGPGGSGKTTQLWTLPQPGFLYIFDPKATDSLQGLNMDYELFSPDLISLDAIPLKNEKADKAMASRIMKVREPAAWADWEEHFDQAVDDEFFKQYKWIGIDSTTTMLDAIMEYVQFLNGRQGKHPEQADYTAQINTFRNVMRALSGLAETIVVLCHEEIYKDEHTGRITYQPLLTGRLRTRLPLLFSNIFRCEVEQEKSGHAFWSMHTTGDKQHQYVRTSVKGLDPVVDATIDDWKHPEKSGLGAIIAAEQSRLTSKKGDK